MRTPEQTRQWKEISRKFEEVKDYCEKRIRICDVLMVSAIILFPVGLLLVFLETGWWGYAVFILAFTLMFVTDILQEQIRKKLDEWDSFKADFDRKMML